MIDLKKILILDSDWNDRNHKWNDQNSKKNDRKIIQRMINIEIHVIDLKKF